MRVTPEIHRQALKLFTETWPRNEEETRLLLEQCGDDTVLRQEVESLLEAEADSGDFIAEPLLRLPKASSDELEPGDLVGTYRIERLLAVGGMGAVYLVANDDPDFEVLSALKIVRPDRARAGVMQRFQREQKILAKLDHPNIVRPKSRGVTPEGDPYLVMDYVEGEPIDRYCARLSIPERIEVFRKVCSAVHYAHQNLIVHRDLKPANILVTSEGEPRILDFGIAQLEDSSPYSTRAETLEQTTSVFLGTLRYASPEQVRNEAQLTTGSDIYSLGVLLYELLGGRHPFEEVCGSFVDLGRAIREEIPERPSRVARLPEVTDPPGSPPGSEREKKPREVVDPGALRRKIQGDLDCIVLKAMSREAGDRYDSAEELSDDLERHQKGLPVEARSFTTRYRLGKFFARHAGKAAGIGLMLPLLVAFCILTLVLWKREKDALEDLESSYAVFDGFVSFFMDGSPDPEITARALLDKASYRVDRAIRWERQQLAQGGRGVQSQDPADATALLEAYGWAYFGIGSEGKAEEWLSEAHDRRLAGERNADFVLTKVRLAAARGALGDLTTASGLRAEAFEVIREGGVDSLRLAQWLNDIGYLLEDRGDLGAAAEIYREALDMKRRLLGDREISVAIGLGNLGSVLTTLGRYEEAVAAYRESLEIRSEVFEDELAQGVVVGAVETGRNNLADALRDLAWSGRDPVDPAWGEAVELLTQALEARRRESPDSKSVAAVQNNWALLELYLGQLNGERALLDSSLDRFGESLRIFEGEQLSWRTGIVLRNRATLFQALGEPAKAEADARRAVELLDSGADDGHWRVLDAKSVHGGCLLDLGFLVAAEPLIRDSVETLEAKPAVSRLALEQARQRLELLEQRLADG